MESARRTAFLAGMFFVITFITAIPALLLYDPVLNDADYILGAGADTRVELGAFLEVLLAIANIATAVVLFPILRRQQESLALGYVTARVVESTVIVVGLINLLSVVTLRQDFEEVTGDDSALNVAGQALVAIHDWTFLLGPGFCVAVGNGLLLGYLMYTSGLVPRPMAVLGLIGGPLIFVSSTLVLFGAYEQTDAPGFLMSLPEIAWEASLGIYLIVKGFRPSPILHGLAVPVTVE